VFLPPCDKTLPIRYHLAIGRHHGHCCYLCLRCQKPVKASAMPKIDAAGRCTWCTLCIFIRRCFLTNMTVALITRCTVVNTSQQQLQHSGRLAAVATTTSFHTTWVGKMTTNGQRDQHCLWNHCTVGWCMAVVWQLLMTLDTTSGNLDQRVWDSCICETV